MEQAQGTSTSGNTNSRCVKRRNHFITFWDKIYYKNELPKNCTYLANCNDSTKNGQYHGHAFIYFKNPTSLAGVKKLFGKECHCEQPKQNSNAIKYVLGQLNEDHRKTDMVEFGKRPMDNGVHQMEQILECNTVSEVMEKMPDTYVKYRNGIKDLLDNKQRQNRYYKPPEVYWIYGPTGTGKTRMAFEAGAIPVEYNNGFFSDWKDARKISIEELRGEIPYRILLKLTDAYHNYYEVNIKGGQKLIDLDVIYITSPDKPSRIYRQQCSKQDSIKQLKRRITKLIDLNNDETPNDSI